MLASRGGARMAASASAIGLAVAAVDGGQHRVLVAVGDVHEPAERPVGVADGERPADEQHAGPDPSLGWVLTTLMRSPRATSRSSSSVPVVVEDLEHATVDHRPLGGEQRLVVGEQPVAGGEELAEHAVLVEHDVSDERPVDQHLEQLALTDLVDHQRGQLLRWPAVGDPQEPLRLEVQPAGPVVEAVGLAPEVARLVLAARPARARIVAPRRRAGPVRGEALDLVPQQLAVVAVVSRLVVVARRPDAGLGEQPQGARRVATIGAEPGEVDERRPVAAAAVDGRLQQRRPPRPSRPSRPAPGPATSPPDRRARSPAARRRTPRDRRRSHLDGRAPPTPPPRRRHRRAHRASHRPGSPSAAIDVS